MEWIKASSVNQKRTDVTQLLLAWDLPAGGQFKLNVEGSRKTISCCIGAGESSGILKVTWFLVLPSI